MKKITIITPCLNAERRIGETVESVLRQSAVLSGRAELEYFICDGGSSDRTVPIVESYQNGAIKLVSSRDKGMYDALAKGLRAATGDIVAYLNAGDYYHRCALDIVLDLFEQKDVQWLTGYNVHYNEKSYFLNVKLPYRYRRSFFASGLYGTTLIFVQQESTFWSSSLSELLDYEQLASFRYAGDYYIWSQFAKKCDLRIAEAYLGGFRIERGQLSENREAYLAEMATISCKPTLFQRLLAVFDKVMWYAPVELKKFMNRDGLFRYDHERQQWM